jgi:hypothetical protein
LDTRTALFGVIGSIDLILSREISRGLDIASERRGHDLRVFGVSETVRNPRLKLNHRDQSIGERTDDDRHDRDDDEQFNESESFFAGVNIRVGPTSVVPTDPAIARLWVTHPRRSVLHPTLT